MKSLLIDIMTIILLLTAGVILGNAIDILADFIHTNYFAYDPYKR